MTFDVEKTRKDFPILSREIQGNNLTYLDNAASSQKPIDVLEGIKQFESNDIPMCIGVYIHCLCYLPLHMKNQERLFKNF